MELLREEAQAQKSLVTAFCFVFKSISMFLPSSQKSDVITLRLPAVISITRSLWLQRSESFIREFIDRLMAQVILQRRSIKRKQSFHQRRGEGMNLSDIGNESDPVFSSRTHPSPQLSGEPV